MEEFRLPFEEEVLGRLVRWGEAQSSVRAMLMTSSRARPQGPVDRLSDYDVILAVTEAERWGQADGWLSDYGTPMVRWGDQGELLGLTTLFEGVVYTDGVKIDYTVWPVALLERIAQAAELPAELEAGYRVLLDKDGQTAQWSAPSYRAFIPPKPTEAEYLALIGEFWFTSTYVAKSLWRDELIFARWCLDQEMRLGTLRRLLEWRMEIDHDWSVRPGWMGRGYKQNLPAATWAELESTFVGPGLEENWEALFRMITLFRRLAKEVGAVFSYSYPQAQDEQVYGYLEAIRRLASEG